jgi:hypothetical protein
VRIDKFVHQGGALVCPLKDGAEFIRLAFSEDVAMSLEFIPFVALDNTGVGDREPVVPLLQRLGDFTQRAVESFASFLLA